MEAKFFPLRKDTEGFFSLFHFKADLNSKQKENGANRDETKNVRVRFRVYVLGAFFIFICYDHF
jgi:hypothetical protein